MDRAIQHNTPENVDRLFSDPNYVAKYCCSKRVAWYGHVIEIFREETGFDFVGKTVLDAGCGTGHALKYIHDHYQPKELFGIDFSNAVLDIAEKICPSANYVYNNLEYPQPRLFDLIISLEVFEHLLNPSLVLENLKSALNTDGYIFITVPDGPRDGFFGHIHKWSLEEFADFSDADILGIFDNVIWAIIGKSNE